MNLFDKVFTIIGPVIIIFAVFIVGSKILTDKAVPTTKEVQQKDAPIDLDMSKPVYTASRAIICPYAILYDRRANHGAEAVHELYTSYFNIEEKAQKLGCELWQDGIKISDDSTRQGDLVTFTLPRGTVLYFTYSYHLRN